MLEHGTANQSDDSLELQRVTDALKMWEHPISLAVPGTIDTSLPLHQRIFNVICFVALNPLQASSEEMLAALEIECDRTDEESIPFSDFDPNEGWGGLEPWEM